MSLKKGIIASLGLFLAFTGIVSAKSDNPQRPDVWRLDHHPINARVKCPIDTETVVVDHDGDFNPGRNLAQDLGESSHTWRKVFADGIEYSGTSGNVKTAFWHGPSSMSVQGVGGNSTGLGYGVSTRTIAEGPTTYTSVNITQSSGGPRNLMVYFASNTIATGSGGGLSTTTLIGEATFYGIDNKGNSVSELVYFSTNHPVACSTSAIAVSNSSDVVRYVGCGNVAWLQVSSFTVRISSVSDAYGLSGDIPQMRIYWGNRFGLPGNIDFNSDVLKVMEAGGKDVTDQTLNPNLSINPTFDTISFPTPPSGLTNDDRSVSVNAKRSN